MPQDNPILFLDLTPSKLTTRASGSTISFSAWSTATRILEELRFVVKWLYGESHLPKYLFKEAPDSEVVTTNCDLKAAENSLPGLRMPAQLILLPRGHGRGTTEVSLTTAGFKFTNLENPILDGGISEAEGTLSDTESDFFMTHIHRVLPREWELCHRIIENIPDGSDTPAAVDEIILKSLPGLNPSMVAPNRAGIISRLDEVGLVQRGQEGLRITYAPTKRGESFLKSAQGVTTNR